jgi:rare lipoprotein A (peptidoglycan hydrolase)
VTTAASHYAPRPGACWDPGQSTHVPQPGEEGYDPRYTAAHLPCGTTLEVDGPAGSITLRVWDHGPWGDRARGLDLSPSAFLAVVGPLGIGVATVRWRVVG